MEQTLKGRCALVAASSRGLGRAVASALARNGARVAVNGRDAVTLERSAALLREETGGDVIAFPGDLAAPDVPQGLVERAAAAFGRLDILVTNAGGPPPGNFTAVTEGDWRRAVDLTLMSAVRLARAALPHMRKNRWGRIVNVTSVTVMQPAPALVLSNALRSAVTAMAKTLAEEAGPDGVTVNNVAPGPFLTDRLRNLVEAEAAKRKVPADQVMREWADATALKRLGRPEEFAAAAAFLCSEAASFVTGTTLMVDGGAYKGL